MTNESKIPTIAERETLLDRIAIARCLCRTDGKYPAESDIVKERSRMTMSAAKGESGHVPPLTAADAGLWLRTNGMFVPEKNAPGEKRNADDLPTGPESRRNETLPSPSAKTPSVEPTPSPKYPTGTV